MKKIFLFILLISPQCIAAQTAEDYLKRGNDYCMGKNGVKKDLNEAKKWYLKAAEMGSTKALRQLGHVSSTAMLYDEAIKWYQKAVDMGDVEGMYELAELYRVLLDHEKEEALLIKAAELGGAKYYCKLGEFYYRGFDYEKAVETYWIACKNNDPDACLHLANMYKKGEGVPIDLNESYALFQKAAELGSSLHQRIFGHLCFERKDYQKALEWYQKAAAQGDDNVLTYIAEMYEYGYGVPKDYKKAEELYYKVACTNKYYYGKTNLNRIRQKIESESKPQLTQNAKTNSKQAAERIISNNLLAVIIANEDYQQESKVDYAKNDGETFKKCCNKVLGVPEKNIHYVANATLNNIIGELDWLQQACEAFNGEASVIFYYAGHGIPDESSGASYLLPVDGNSRILRTCFSLDELYGMLGKLPAKKVTVLMDACFSGAVRSGGMLAAARGVAIKAKSSLPVGNMIVLSAAQGNETAYKYDKGQHGLFTYFLLKKLNDTNGKVTLGELSEFVTDQVTRHSIVDNGKSQTPSVIISNPLRTSWKTLKFY